MHTHSPLERAHSPLERAHSPLERAHSPLEDAHSSLAHLIPPAAHAAHTVGHTLGAPRAYEAFVNLFFLGRRRASFLALMDAAGVQPGQRVLDVGCGTGFFARLLAQRVGHAGQVIGVDASADMVRYASEQARNLDNCQFEIGTAESLSFSSGEFDVVVSSLFMHHLPAEVRPAALDEMRRVLRPGGTLLVAEAHVPQSPVWQLLARLHGFDRMARAVDDLEQTILAARFTELRSGVIKPCLRYVRAVRSPQ